MEPVKEQVNTYRVMIGPDFPKGIEVEADNHSTYEGKLTFLRSGKVVAVFSQWAFFTKVS